MLHRLLRTTAAATMLALSLLVVSPQAGAGELGLNVYGLSHYFNEAASGYHQVNPGLGVNWMFARSGRASLEGDAGIWSDAFAQANTHLSVGGRVRVAGPFALGVHLANTVASWADGGRVVVKPTPFVAVDLPRATWTVSYVPEVRTINPSAMLATYVTVYPWRAHRRGSLDEGGGTGFSGLEFTIPRLGMLSGMTDYGGGLSYNESAPTGSDGFVWRHMFDDRQGLRLGCLFNGTAGWFEPGARPVGTYNANLLIQYVRRQAPHGRLRTYWASGLESHFTGGYEHDYIDDSWATDFGLECNVGGGLALLLEYGLKVNYQWSTTYYAGDPDTERATWHLAPTGARLAVVAWFDDAGPGTPAVAGQSRCSGPLVLLGENFKPLATGIGWQWASSPSRAWRVTAYPRVDDDRQSGTSYTAYGLSLRAERLWRRPGAHGVSTYWGAGPMAYYFTDHRYQDYGDGSTFEASSHHFQCGATVLAGVDYPLGANLTVLAEYSAGLIYETYQYHESDQKLVSLQGNDVRLGLQAGF